MIGVSIQKKKGKGENTSRRKKKKKENKTQFVDALFDVLIVETYKYLLVIN